jgi:hypothetical protein
MTANEAGNPTVQGSEAAEAARRPSGALPLPNPPLVNWTREQVLGDSHPSSL